MEPKTCSNGELRPRQKRGTSSSPKFVLFVFAYALLSLLLDGSHTTRSSIFVTSLSMRTPSSPKIHSTAGVNDGKGKGSDNEIDNDKMGTLSRRNVLGTTAASLLGFAGGTMAPWFATIEAAQAAEGKGPVAIVGASGRTGSLCVNAVSTTMKIES